MLGLGEVPAAGELFSVAASERAHAVGRQQREDAAKRGTGCGAQDAGQVFAAYKAGQRGVPLVLKADVQGSLEPISHSIEKLADEIKVNILHAATGNIGELDVMRPASEAVILGFNVELDQSARRLAEKEGVDIRLYDIIYRLTEDIEKALKGMLEPVFKEIITPATPKSDRSSPRHQGGQSGRLLRHRRRADAQHHGPHQARRGGSA